MEVMVSWSFTSLTLVIVAGFPLLLWLLRCWNEIRFVLPALLRCKNGEKIPPGDMGLPIIGEMYKFLWCFKLVKRPDDFIINKKHRYGEGVGLYRSHLFGSPTIIACSPAVNKFVLQSSDLFAIQWPSVELVGYNSIVAVDGAAHDRLRAFVVNAVNRPEALKEIILTVQPRLIAALRLWAEQGVINAYKETKKVTFENICKMFASFEPGPALNDLDEWFRGMVAGLRAIPLYIPGTANHHALKCRRKLNNVFKSELERRQQEGLETVGRNDLMEGLMKIKDEQGQQLRAEEVVDNIVSLIVAGYESTGLSTMWALYYLAKFPDVLERLRAEHQTIFEQKEGELLTMKDINKMKYTQKVIQEILRMANLALAIMRLAKEDVNYEGYRIPKDWRVVVWIRHLHTDPNNFDDPFNFNPEQWNDSAKPGTYQVFGGGPRICAGNMLARIQLSVFLHHLTISYRWKLLNPDSKINYLPHPMPADGAKMEFQMNQPLSKANLGS